MGHISRNLMETSMSRNDPLTRLATEAAELAADVAELNVRLVKLTSAIAGEMRAREPANFEMREIDARPAIEQWEREQKGKVMP